MDQDYKTSFWYFKKRFTANKPALAGFVVIIISIFIAILGYTIMPDDSTNANNALPEIKKQKPGFSTEVLRIKKNVRVEEKSFIQVAISGSESKYLERPYDSLQFLSQKGMLRVYLSQGRGALYEDFSYADIVYSVRGEITQSKEELIFKTIENKDLTENISELENKIKKDFLFERTYRLGTDSAGRDLLSRLLFGTRVSLMIGLITVIVALLIGIFLGGVAGYFGGKVDALVMWFMTVIWSIPRIMLVIVIGLALQSKGLWVAFVAVGLTMWTEVARVVRGKIMEVKEKQYVTAAKVLGLGNLRIIFGHILPNILGSVVVIATANFADAILIEAGLSFLGLGVPPPVPSWGQMVNEGFALITNKNCWHLIFYPSMAICVLVLSFNLLGNGLRDALDPKS